LQVKSRPPVLISAFVFLCLVVLGGGKANQLWISDNRDGTYKNPIIFADYSDPDVIRVGDDFCWQAREGKWIGAKVGLFCLGGRTGGYADFDWFRFEAKEE